MPVLTRAAHVPVGTNERWKAGHAPALKLMRFSGAGKAKSQKRITDHGLIVTVRSVVSVP